MLVIESGIVLPFLPRKGADSLDTTTLDTTAFYDKGKNERSARRAPLISLSVFWHIAAKRLNSRICRSAPSILVLSWKSSIYREDFTVP